MRDDPHGCPWVQTISGCSEVRAFMGKEDTEVSDEGSNPTDDEIPPSAFLEDGDDLSREEVMEGDQGDLTRATGRARRPHVAGARGCA